MASVGTVTKHFATAKEGFVTTLASTIGSGAATVPLNSVTGYANGDVAVFIIEPANATNKQAFTGTIDTAGVQLTGVVWTEGSNITHNAGATVVDYVAATHMSMFTKGMLVEHKQTGAHAAVTADSVTATGVITAASFAVTGGGGAQGWSTGLPAPDTVTYNGGRSYTAVFNAADHTDIVSNGDRLRFTRTVTAPIQCTSLNGTTQYFNKTSPTGTTFTDDFAGGSWVKMTSYAAAGIISRYNGTSGWELNVTATGSPYLVGHNAAAANFSQVLAYATLPLNKWVHVAAQLDMSSFTATTTTSYVMIDGLDVVASVARGGTNPTALVQAGDLNVGASNSATPFPGKISNAFYSSAKITQANVRTLISQSITSAQCTTHSIVSAYTLNNTLNDVNTTSANNLTAQGSALATNTDAPFSLGADLASSFTDGTTDFAVVTSNSFSTNTTFTFQVAEGCTVPTTGGITAVFYSNQNAYGFPSSELRWTIETLFVAQQTVNATTPGTWYNFPGGKITLPLGEWNTEFQAYVTFTNGGSSFTGGYLTLSNANNTISDKRFATTTPDVTATSSVMEGFLTRRMPISATSATDYYLNVNPFVSSTNASMGGSGGVQMSVVTMKLAYV